MVCGRSACNGPHRGRTDDNLFALRPGKIEVYSGQTAIEPLFSMTQHEMILRVPWIRVPGLGQSRRAHPKLVSVTRSVSARQYIVNHVRTASIGKRLHYEMKPDTTRGDMVLMLTYV